MRRYRPASIIVTRGKGREGKGEKEGWMNYTFPFGWREVRKRLCVERKRDRYQVTE